MKRPAFQFYPADWRKDAALQSCSVAARGLWMEMICIMHESENYGFLEINGKKMCEKTLARLVGETPTKLKKYLSELESMGVFSMNDQGVIFSRRMLKDQEIREARADGGKAGAEHGIKGKEHGSKGGRPVQSRGDNKPPLNPPPSSSSSSSSSPSGDLTPNPLCTIEQAKSYAPTVKMTPEQAQHWWHTRNASGWTKGNAGGGSARKITSWQSDMATSLSWVGESLDKSKNGNGPAKKRGLSSNDVGI